MIEVVELLAREGSTELTGLVKVVPAIACCAFRGL